MLSSEQHTFLSEVEIRPLTDSDDLDILTGLINTAYKKLALQGFRYLGSHQDTETTKRRIKKGQCFVATHNSKIIGTIIYYPPTNHSVNEWYNQSFVAGYGQFAVNPEFQNRGVGSMLISYVEQLAINDYALEITIDTAEGATALINYYTKKGYRFITYTQWNETNYRSVLLSKKLDANSNITPPQSS